ncbi:biopolymer transporter ExbD [Fulvimarina sp. MAC3]|uniref:biopolymer transporter ExbD n=1 Tax=Fulvimarina sp. MAC3 TaxID=3148887 RepID=UPI0031FDC541
MRQAPTERRRLDFSMATINVVFLLLLFFILSGTIIEPIEAEIDPAVTRSLPVERLPRPLLVLRGENDIVLEGEAVQRSELAGALSQIERDEAFESGRIYVLSSRTVAASLLLDMASELSGRGFAVSLVTLRDNPGVSP